MKKIDYKLIGLRLKQARETKHISLEEAGQKVGVNKSTIMRWEKGKTEKFKIPTLEILAELYCVNPQWLMGHNVPMDTNYGKSKLTEINVINLSTNEVVQTVPYSYRTDIAEDDPKNYFAICASDSSMAPLLDVGDIAIIRKFDKFINMKTYLLKIKQGSPIIRKVIQSDDGKIELQAMNMWNFPTQTDLTLNDIEILGEVVRVENKSAFK